MGERGRQLRGTDIYVVGRVEGFNGVCTSTGTIAVTCITVETSSILSDCNHSQIIRKSSQVQNIIKSSIRNKNWQLV